MERVAQDDGNRRVDSVSNTSTRKKVKFYIEIAILVMIVMMMVATIVKNLFGGLPVESHHIKDALGLLHALDHGLPLAAAMKWENTTNF